jgi:hypothetical protein
VFRFLPRARVSMFAYWIWCRVHLLHALQGNAYGYTEL